MPPGIEGGRGEAMRMGSGGERWSTQKQGLAGGSAREWQGLGW